MLLFSLSLQAVTYFFYVDALLSSWSSNLQSF